MTKTITILAISTILVSGAFIPLAEASAGWNGFLREIGFGTPVYEVSGVSVIPALSLEGNLVELRCMDGDWYLVSSPAFSLSLDPSIDPTNIVLTNSFQTLHESDITKIPYSRVIGLDITTQLSGPMQLFDVPVIVKGLCLNPESFTSVVGGVGQEIDTVALFIGYSVLNAYWLAPTLVGIGAGVYLTKTKWKNH